MFVHDLFYNMGKQTLATLYIMVCLNTVADEYIVTVHAQTAL